VNVILEKASLLIDRFHDLLDALTQRIDLNDNKEIYKVIFEIFHQTAYGRPLLLKDLWKDARLLSVLNLTREFLNLVHETINNYSANLSALAQEMFRKALMEVSKLPKSLPRYVIMCDGLSIIDATYIAYTMKKEGVNLFVAPLINPGGVTETYKFVLEPHAYLRGVNFTLKDLARKIAEMVNAKGFTVFGDYDRTIHQLKDVEVSNIVDTMYRLTLKLYDEIIRRRNFVVIVLSDHGYDIVEKSASLYEVRHSWSPSSLSVIAPLLVVG